MTRGSTEALEVLLDGVQLRDRDRRAGDVAGNRQRFAGAANQAREFLVGDLVDLPALLDDDERRAVLGRVVEARDDAVAIADLRTLFGGHLRVRHPAEAVADFSG